MNKEASANRGLFMFRAGEEISAVLLGLFNDTSEEAKLLVYQLEILKNHLRTVSIADVKTFSIINQRKLI